VRTTKQRSYRRHCWCGALLEAGERRCSKCEARSLWQRHTQQDQLVSLPGGAGHSRQAASPHIGHIGDPSPGPGAVLGGIQI
jgi:hypothetical protein